MINLCLRTSCERRTVNNKEIIVFKPTILLRDAKQSHAKAWDDHLKFLNQHHSS